ncbi:MAG TPA: hypothetical protein ENN73_05365, partial [Firmicutes bacterium]|nr:hypothetical protein [Bacillota bacterium]
MKKSFFALFLVVLLISGVIGIDETLLFSEEELITVATKTPVQKKAAPAAVTVITKAQIEAMGYTTLAEILQSVPGIYISISERHMRRLAIRNLTSSYNDKALLLINGIPYREVFYGHLFLDEYFPVDMIKQIEIVRGPSSALYGTNAFSGVINIITLSGSDLKDCDGYDLENGGGLQQNLTVRAGTHDTSEIAVISGGKY